VHSGFFEGRACFRSWKESTAKKWKRMSVAVVDAWAVLALLQGEAPAAFQLRRYLRRARAGSLRLLLNWVNLGEVYYRVARKRGLDTADETLKAVRALPLELYPARDKLVLEAARLKGSFAISYADAFAVATARAEGGPVLTGDPEIVSLPRRVVAVRRLERSRRETS
jgi:predicted nucleic acid-binding protein